MTDFVAQTINSWREFVDAISQHQAAGKQWIYRGQRSSNWELRTTFERTLGAWGADLQTAPLLEERILRDFRRRYTGDHSIIDTDTLHCLALMQHHGAPTRLLDCTYSPYVAAYFAIESGAARSAIWCINCEWCQNAAGEIVGLPQLDERDKWRDELTFRKLYMNSNAKNFVFTENPFHLNSRLIIQQGVFLCPGNVRTEFTENFVAMRGAQDRNNILKLDLNLSMQGVREFSAELRRMNIGAAALFPGLDGFARSLGERISLYHDLMTAHTP